MNCIVTINLKCRPENRKKGTGRPDGIRLPGNRCPPERDLSMSANDLQVHNFRTFLKIKKTVILYSVDFKRTHVFFLVYTRSIIRLCTLHIKSTSRPF